MSLPYPIPSFAQGFARSASQSLFPNLWKGLVGLWAPYVGVQGQILYDWSMNRNDGALINMTNDDWIIGKDSLALSLNGSTRYINCGNKNSLSLSNEISIASRIKIDTSSANFDHTVIAKRNASVDNYQFRLDADVPRGGAGHFNFAYSSAGPVFHIYASDNQEILPNFWYDIAFSYIYGTAASAKLYKNGNEVPGAWDLGTGAVSPPTTGTNDVYIGRYESGVSDPEWLNGQIEFLYLYNRVLLPQEIALLHAISHAPLILRDDLMAFLEVVAPQILDLFNPQIKSLKQKYQLESEKQIYQLKSLKQKGQIKWLQ